jgi:hypothetical protein
MRLLILPPIAALGFAGAAIFGGDLASATTTQSLDSGRTAAPPAVILALSEVRIDQAKGRIYGKLPEIGNSKTNAGDSVAGNHRPQTCDASNATSQGCATATQQARPLAK